MSMNTSLTIIYFLYPPMINLCSLTNNSLQRSESCPFPGFSAEITIETIKASGIPYDVLRLPVNSTFSSIFDVIDAQPNACSVAFFMSTKERETRFVVSKRLIHTDIAAIYSRRELMIESLLKFVKVFNYDTWLVFFALFVACRLGIELYKTEENWGEFAHNCLVVVSFFVALTIKIYEGGLLTQLMLRSRVDVFTDLETLGEAISSKRITLMAWKNDAVFKVLTRQEGWAPVKEALRSNPMVYIRSNADMNKKLYSGSYVMVDDELVGMHLESISADFKSVRFDLRATVHYHMLCNKNTSEQLLNKLNQAIDKAQTFLAGFPIRNLRKLKVEKSRLRSEGANFGTLSLIDTLGMFTVVMVGALLSFGITILESIVWRLQSIR